MKKISIAKTWGFDIFLYEEKIHEKMSQNHISNLAKNAKVHPISISGINSLTLSILCLELFMFVCPMWTFQWEYSLNLIHLSSKQKLNKSEYRGGYFVCLFDTLCAVANLSFSCDRDITLILFGFNPIKISGVFTYARHHLAVCMAKVQRDFIWSFAMATRQGDKRDKKSPH